MLNCGGQKLLHVMPFKLQYFPLLHILSSLNIFILWYHEDILLITFIYLIPLVGWSAHAYVCVASIFIIPVDCFCE